MYMCICIYVYMYAYMYVCVYMCDVKKCPFYLFCFLDYQMNYYEV